MSKRETLDYLKLCSNYYSNNEDGCCMESCEYYNHDECPVVYVNGLITELEEKLALTEKALELACKELRDNSCMQCNSCNRYEMCDYVLSLYPASYFIKEAKEIKDSE